MPRLRQRLDQLQSEANATMEDARQTLAQARQSLTVADKQLLTLVEKSMQSLSILSLLGKEILDGVTFELEVLGQPLPGKLKISLREDGET